MSLTEKEEVLGILIERSLNKNDAHHDHVYYDDDCESDHPHVHGEKLGKQNLQNGLCPGFIWLVFSFNLTGQLFLEAIQNKTSQVFSNLLQNIAISKLQWLDFAEF